MSEHEHKWLTDTYRSGDSEVTVTRCAHCDEKPIEPPRIQWEFQCPRKQCSDDRTITIGMAKPPDGWAVGDPDLRHRCGTKMLLVERRD